MSLDAGSTQFKRSAALTVAAQRGNVRWPIGTPSVPITPIVVMPADSRASQSPSPSASGSPGRQMTWACASGEYVAEPIPKSNIASIATTNRAEAAMDGLGVMVSLLRDDPHG